MTKLRCYITSPVFKEIATNEKISEEKRSKLKNLWIDLEDKVDLKISNTRFPSEHELKEVIDVWTPNIIGCHLSHNISEEMLQNPEIIAVCTSTAGYNHIYQYPGVLITHTPGVLHRTVADFTISIIMTNLRNLVGLHNFVWNEEWKSGQKWDLDENLSSTIDSKVIGIIGLGEIGKELASRLSPWGIKLLYHDIKKRPQIEEKIKNLLFVPNLEDVFAKCDVISIHIPLNNNTKHLIGRNCLKLMKKDALLVNTARGAIIDFSELIELLESEEIEINLAFDVYENEPINPDLLKRFKNVSDSKKNLRFIFIPHNASADANTRAQMAIMLLEDILKIVKSTSRHDLTSMHLIPEQRTLLYSTSGDKKLKEYRIGKFWI